MTIWIPGASGFVGRALTSRLQAEGQGFYRVSRRASQLADDSIFPAEALGQRLQKEDVVIYCAGLAHTQGDPAAFHQANCDEPLAAARLAASRGAKRFVFVSSVKVNGERTTGVPFSEHDAPAPVDMYGRSKLLGEQALWQQARQSGMELVVVRPPLVYGPGVRANFAAMVKAVRRGMPLPLASIQNKRSLIYVENLADLLVLCARHPAAVNRVVMASDGQDLSTPALLRLTGEALGKPARLWPCPESVLKRGAALLGKRAVADRLCDSLQVNDDFARDKLMWRPPFSVEEGLRRTVGGLA
ncbi:NAD-dependent epimerase/dehydratase family protein [Marinimicrobium sp. ARAG 43.8]|uniref:NAD-dependent epimerase/dehydratase family protein n=1 Tax=Marinimicrobium sp. ARAG 43.8 TaxID=3418719 RepID=UPI003CE77B86